MSRNHPVVSPDMFDN